MWFWNKITEIRYAKRSPKWPAIRQEHLKKQPCCQCCGSCIKPEVHHIVPVHLDQSKELDKDNLITLCDKYCHFIFGHLMDWKSYNKNIEQQCINFYRQVQDRP